MTEFNTLGLSPALVKALGRAGLSTPTPIQAKAIPIALKGRDLLGLAQTGTGKTLAFGLPMIDKLLSQQGKPTPKSVKALVLAPTRELVNQIADNLRPLVQGTPMRVTTVVGGQSIHRQIQNLNKGTDILVATPGRLMDLMDRGAVRLSTASFLVLDEADQMLDLGFIHTLRKIVPHLGSPRQTMLFSATMPKTLEDLSQSYLDNPERVEVAPPGKTADKIDQSVIFVDKAEKPVKLREILSQDPEALSLVFSRTKHGAEKLMKKLVEDGYNAASIHGNKSQGQRDRAIKAFREGQVKVLVATDVAARGIDIPGVSYVINFDLPNVPEAYVHRIGRTARAGRDGTAISFCSPDERPYLRDIEKLIGRRFGAGPDEKAEKPAARPRRKGAGKPGGRKGNGAGQKPEAATAGAGAGAEQKPKRRRNRRPKTAQGKPMGGGQPPRRKTNAA